MTTQSIFTFATPEPSEEKLTIQEQFQRFHEANPWVYLELKKLAMQLKARGHKKIGMKMLFEVLRWNFYMQAEDPTSPYLLNNNYTSRYARLLAANVPQLANTFEQRTLKTS